METGHFITKAEYGIGKWILFFGDAKVTGYTHQGYERREGLEDRWKANQKITSIANGLHQWFVLFSKSTSYYKQGYEASSSVENFEIKLKDRNAKEYRLVNLSQGWQLPLGNVKTREKI